MNNVSSVILVLCSASAVRFECVLFYLAYRRPLTLFKQLPNASMSQDEILGQWLLLHASGSPLCAYLLTVVTLGTCFGHPH